VLLRDPLWAELINSDWRDHRGSGAREDRIGNDSWLRAFLMRCGWQEGRLLNTEERKALRELRQLLRRIAEIVRVGGTADPTDMESLNAVLAAAPVRRRLEIRSDGLQVVLEPVSRGIEALLGEVASDFAAMMAGGEPTRIKVCANPDCGWFMYDSSRNRSRRWCDKTECGNLIKVRRHRSKMRGDV
jgi:predicted RNA-binding Zn ribbon-like protein